MTKVSVPSRLLQRELRGSDQGLYHCDNYTGCHSPRQVKFGIRSIRNRHLQEDAMNNQEPLWDVAGVGERSKWKVNPREQVVFLVQFNGILNQDFFFPDMPHWHWAVHSAEKDSDYSIALGEYIIADLKSFPTTYATFKISTKGWPQVTAPDRNIRRPGTVHLSFQLSQIILIAF